MYFKQLMCGAMLMVASSLLAQNNVAEEVAWVVGDTPIWKSEIEEQFQNLRYDNKDIKGDPYCVIPERMAIQKLFLHQAELDTIEANEGQVISRADGQINYLIQELGSKEKVESYFRKSMAELRQNYMDAIRDESRVQQVQRELTKNIKTTPSDIRRYFAALDADSVPYVPLQVEAQIITMEPVIPREDVEDVKARLRQYAEAVNNGESEFSTLAILYSEDGSSVRGGELGFMSRAELDPNFAAVAFNLNDPKKASRIVESEYGYHIIQLIDKRGDQVNVRHILLTPKVNEKDLREATVRLDSLRKEIVAGKFPFEDAARYVSQDKDTKNNRGVMVNPQTGSPRFEMQELPPEVARRVEMMKPGDVSEAFIMKDTKRNKDIVAIVKLTSRVPGHKANLSDDYNMLKEMYEAKRKEEILKEWVERKIKDTYVKIADGWQNCEFEYEGWIK